jgi:hypothetical protein
MNNIDILIEKNISFSASATLSLENYEKSKLLAFALSRGECTTDVSDKNIPLLLTLSLSDGFSKSEARNIYDCLSLKNFDSERYYNYMVSSLISWVEQGKVKIMYLTLFNNYVPSRDNIFGLIEFSMLFCKPQAEEFFKKVKYSTNANKILSASEYKEFRLYVEDKCQ